MKQYLDLLSTVLETGIEKRDRTGTGTISSFGHHLKFDLSQGFPLVTTKKMFWPGVVDELLWFLSGSTNVNDIPARSRQLWLPWATKSGEVGPMYGYQWQQQLDSVLELLETDPNSRRLLVSSWEYDTIPLANHTPQENVDYGAMALAPCHFAYQFYIANNKLSCQVYQRSADLFLGTPFNLASYALLTHMVAKTYNMGVGSLSWAVGDAHIYLNHLEQVKEQLLREPYDLPCVYINKKDSIFEYTEDDIELVGYFHHPRIAGKVSV